MTNFKKIDDAVAAPDKTASALLPLLVRRNLQALCEARAPQCMHVWQFSEDFQESGVKAVSTHPEDWWGWPFLVPRCRGVQQLEAQIHYKVSADVDARLYVDGSHGSTVTLTSTTDAYATLTANMSDQPGAGEWAVAFIAFQSSRDGAAIGSVYNDVRIERFRAGFDFDTASGSITAGQQHLVIGESGRNAVYVGHAENQSGTTWDIRSWPAGGITGANVYELSTVTPYGVTFRMVGNENATGALPIPSKDPMTVKQTMQSDQMDGLSDGIWALYRERGLWFCCGPSPSIDGSRPHRHGVASDDAVPPWACTVERRVDTEGLRVAMAGLGTLTAQLGADVDVDVTVRNIDSSVDETTTISGSGQPMPVDDEERQLARYLREYNGADYADFWGGGDMIRAAEIDALTVVADTVDWPAGTSNGDRLLVSAGTDFTGWDLVLAASVAEAYPRRRPA